MIKKIAHLADIHILNDGVWHDRYKEGFENVYKKFAIRK